MACRKPALFYKSGELRDQEWQIALGLAQHQLDERGELYSGEDVRRLAVEHLARVIMMPRVAFTLDAKRTAGDVDQLMRLHRYTPRHAILSRLCDLSQIAERTHLRLVAAAQN